MKPEDSIFLECITSAVNDLVMTGADPEEAILAAERIAFDHLRKVSHPSLQFVDRAAQKHVSSRQMQKLRVRRRTAKAYWKAFAVTERVLAVAEIANQAQVESSLEVWRQQSESEPLLGTKELFGGPPLKCLLITSLHARSVLIMTEVLESLRLGHCEGAAARTRTLYEVTVVLWFLCNGGLRTRKNYELCERYYVSLASEKLRLKQVLDDKERSLVAAAKAKWGNDCMEPYEWARPVIGERVGARRRIRLGDLERFVEVEDLRPWYEQFNSAVHSGALNTVRRSDFRRQYPNATGPEYEPDQVRRVGDVALLLLQFGTYSAVKSIATEAKEWDDMLVLPKFEDLVGEARVAFRTSVLRNYGNATPS